jgi:rhamnosyltransferase
MKIEKEDKYQDIDRSLIACIFVLYHPKVSELKKIDLLAEFGYAVIIVINAIDQYFLKDLQSKSYLHVINNSKNIGLASALNQGIEYAFDHINAQFVILFDQDSEPHLELPVQLVSEFMAHDCDLACIGPTLTDVKSLDARYLDLNKSSVQTIATSGTVISKEAFAKVGPMMDDLFIDSIDHEWCFRAMHKGFNIIVSKKVLMPHNMGDEGLNWIGQYKPVYRNPIRHFYIIRNSIYLIKLSYIPLSWRIIELLKTLRRVVMYLWISNDRLKSLRLICKAVIDGFLNRLGPLTES